MTTDLTNRWYYRDPLAAAWMADKFGMKIVISNNSFATVDGEYLWANDAISVLDQWNEDPLCGEIHPDSLHLLEPSIGDMVTNIGMTAWRVIGICAELLLIDADRTALKREVTIIQRNGIPFMWPLRSEYPNTDES